MKKKYTATFRTSGTYGIYTFTNKRTAVKWIIEIAKGNRPCNDTADWEVSSIDGFRKTGWIDRDGNNHYIY